MGLNIPVHHQIGMDLARHAADKASSAMLDAIALCESSAQATMVAFHVLGIVAAQACGVVTSHLGIDRDAMDSPQMMELMASMMREAATSEALSKQEA